MSEQQLNLNCPVKTCPAAPADLTVYNLQDALFFNGTPLSILVSCPPGYQCNSLSGTLIFTYPPGTFQFPKPPGGAGNPLVFSLRGCSSVVTIVLPAGSSVAAQNAAAQQVISQVAAQQAQCDAAAQIGPGGQWPQNPAPPEPPPPVTCPFDAISWDAPILSGNATGSTGVGTFALHDQPNASNPWESTTDLTGSFVYTGPLYAATLRVNAIQFLTTSGMGGDTIGFGFDVTSSVDGLLTSQGLTNPSAGIYDFVFNLPASVGATISIAIYGDSGFVDFGPGGTGQVQITGDFCP